MLDDIKLFQKTPSRDRPTETYIRNRRQPPAEDPFRGRPRSPESVLVFACRYQQTTLATDLQRAVQLLIPPSPPTAGRLNAETALLFCS